MIVGKIKFHPYADIFPLMNSKELEELSKDIFKNGLREAIKLLDGMILEISSIRHRY